MNKAFQRQEAKLRAERPHSSLHLKYPDWVTGWRGKEECWLPGCRNLENEENRLCYGQGFGEWGR